MANARPRWIVGLETWVMEDGNYGNFTAGDTTEFALEFWDRTLAPTDLRQAHAEHLAGHRYRIVAPVVCAEGRFWMIDIGVRAYMSSAPGWLEEGGWVAGEIDLNIDCFQYFEQWGPGGGALPAIYTWRIAGIREHSAPRPPDDGVTYVDPDDMPWTARDVERTAAWETPENLEVRYELVCERLDDGPRRQLAREW